jgi:hypothetical protein
MLTCFATGSSPSGKQLMRQHPLVCHERHGSRIN